MIALDTSALVAVALDEAEASSFSSVIAQNRCHVGWPTLFETYLVLHRRVDREFAHAAISSLISAANISAVEFGQQLFASARAAFDAYGKGRHRASLNFGDCMASAVAKSNELPLLFKGDHFRHTDMRPALP